MCKGDSGFVPEVLQFFRIPVADPLNLPVGDIALGDNQDRDDRVFDLVGVASPGASGVGAGQLHVQLVGDAIDNHDEVGWPSAIEIRINFGSLPSGQHGHPVFGDVPESGWTSDSPPRSRLSELLSQARNGT